MEQRGFAAIGLFNPKEPNNIGSVLRAAACYDAALVAIRGARCKKSATDTTAAWRHIPVIHTTDDLLDQMPFGAVPAAVEFINTAQPLHTYKHPHSAFYIFGPEDNSLPPQVLAKCRDVVYVPTLHCMNLAATVNVLLYDRLAKQLKG